MRFVFWPHLIAEAGTNAGGSSIAEVCSGVGLGALIAVPVSLLGSVIGARAGMVPERWFDSLIGSIGRLPTLLTSVLLGLFLVSRGVNESPAMWGMVAMVAGTPVIWRISARALSELPVGILESALALGLSRLRTLWVVGYPVVGPALTGAVVVGVARALTVGWLVYELRQTQKAPPVSEWWQVVAVVSVVTLLGSWLLGVGRRKSKALERASS
ncbi:hypothetical protein HAHE_35830 [Haloferula helveola]|uniref:ABC transporter permease subunit n=1 Tax=Haloferula helveola TaxID=490095 RepID=A0ABN6H7N2_9BACT|nr:hypothetical protein HAHE_35830 [Haloferula helveola]